MPHAIATVLAAKAVIAKTCAAALVVGTSGVAFVSFAAPEEDDLGSVSVEYAPEKSEFLAFSDIPPEEMTGEAAAEKEAAEKEAAEKAAAEKEAAEQEEADKVAAEKEAAEKAAAEKEAADKEAAEKAAAEKEAADKEATDKEAAEKEAAEADKTAPELKILYPADGSHHDNKVIVFEGVTEPGAEVFAGKYAAKVDARGNWRIELVLSPGANGAQFTATDKAGNTTYSKVTVWLDVEEKAADPKKDETEEAKDPKPEAENVEFYAKQKYGVCDAENPYEILWGTATPNTVVEVTSPYGSGVAEVSKYGHWEIKVYFPNAPRNEAFNIKVSAANGSATFNFVAKSWEEPEPKESDKPEHEETESEEPKHDENAEDS